MSKQKRIYAINISYANDKAWQFMTDDAGSIIIFNSEKSANEFAILLAESGVNAVAVECRNITDYAR